MLPVLLLLQGAMALGPYALLLLLMLGAGPGPGGGVWGAAAACRVSEFLCDTGQCISLDKVCDGRDDCEDKSDERPFCTRKSHFYSCKHLENRTPLLLSGITSGRNQKIKEESGNLWQITA